jgi:hypothetical protein
VHPDAFDVCSAGAVELFLGGVRHRAEAGLAAGGRDHLGGVHGCAARGVQLARVVLLDDLDGFEVAGRLGRELHHQHRADAEVRGDQHADLRLVRQPAADPVKALLGEAAGAHHHADALVHRPVHVVHHHVGGGEVDEHLGARVGRVEEPVALVDHGHQFEVVGGVDCLAHLEAHAAAGAEDADADRFLLVRHADNLTRLLHQRSPSPTTRNTTAT